MSASRLFALPKWWNHNLLYKSIHHLTKFIGYKAIFPVLVVCLSGSEQEELKVRVEWSKWKSRVCRPRIAWKTDWKVPHTSSNIGSGEDDRILTHKCNTRRSGLWSPLWDLYNPYRNLHYPEFKSNLFVTRVHNDPLAMNQMPSPMRESASFLAVRKLAEPLSLPHTYCPSI